MSVEDFAALGGVTIKGTPKGLPETVADRLQHLAAMHEPEEMELSGGLAEEDE